MTKYIFLDTNNWIYLSNGFNILSNKYDELHLKVFDIIKKRVEEGLLVFLVNDIVIEEWRRNKPQTENQIKDIENKYKSYKNSLKTIKSFVKEGIDTELLKIKNELDSTFEKKVNVLKNHVAEVEDFLLNKTQKIELDDKIKVEAANLALEKKAPFIGDKKNSMADALILLNSIEYLYQNQKTTLPPQTIDSETEVLFFPESYFVSSNKGDFSSEENKEKIHPDLTSKLEKTNTEFFFTLGKLINSLEEEFLTIEEERAIEHADDSVYCVYCDSAYYPSVQFSEEFLIPDGNKGQNLIGQYRIDFGDNHNHDYKDEDFMSAIRTANCTFCGAEYIECTCGELNFIEEYNKKFYCAGECGNVFIVHADIDRKGMVHDLQYEIVVEHRCEKCGEMFDEVDESGYCEVCAVYEKISINN